jgi:hypothetical protein
MEDGIREGNLIIHKLRDTETKFSRLL